MSVTARSRRCLGRGRSSPVRDHPRQEAHARQPARRPAASRAGCSTPFTGSNLVYNQCWEDPAVDHEALRLRPADRVLVITSAGCNALDYALSGRERPGRGRQPAAEPPARAQARRHPRPRLRGLLRPVRPRRLRARAGDLRRAAAAPCPRPSREHWDREIRLFEPDRARGRSFYYGGTSGLVALAMKGWIRHGARLWSAVERLLAARTLEEQLGIYHDEVRHRLLGEGLLRFVGSPAVMSLVGVPEPQRRMILERPGGFPAFLRDCIDHVMSVALLRENYFWSVYLNGSYSRESCPRYLAGGELRSPEGGARRERADLHRHGHGVPGPGSRARHRLRAPRPHGLAGPEAASARGGVGAGSSAWRARARASSSAAAGGTSSSCRSPSCAASVSSASGRRPLHRRDRVGTYASFHIARLAPAV